MEQREVGTRPAVGARAMVRQEERMRKNEKKEVCSIQI